MTSPTVTQEVMIATKEDISRLELAVDKLTKTVENVILIGERQTVQGQRIGELEKENTALKKQVEILERKVDSWINRGVGAWLVLALIAGILKFFVGK